ncbi:MAG: hypothetical protein PEPC_01667 [Peptostreptococcus russellii]
MKPANQKEIRRVPRTLNPEANSETASKLYGMGGSVMFDIVIFLANFKLRDLFGETWFSINDFCDYMGYDRTTLQRKLTEKQKKDLLGNTKAELRLMSEDGIPVVHPIETYFEAALYKLGKENLAIQVPNGDGTSSYNFIQIIERFDIKYDFKTQKKTRRMYNAILGKRIIDTIFYDYNLIELSDYRQLPDRTGYRRFYLNLSKMISLVKFKMTQGKSPYFSLTVDQLATIFDINVAENKKRKQKVTEILSNINEILKVTKFDFKYVRGATGRWAYTVEFNFPQETLNYFDEKFKAVFTSKYYARVSDLFFTLVKKVPVRDVYKWTPELKVDPVLQKEFLDWQYSNEDIEAKQKVYRETFYRAFSKYPEELDHDWDNIIL